MSERTGPHDGPTDVSDGDKDGNSDYFEGRSIDRRTFLSVAAATGTALSLVGTAAGEEPVESELLSSVAEFAINHTPDDYEAGLVVEFADASAAETFDETFSYDYDDDRPRPAKTVIRTEPTPAGHGRLTTPEVQTLLDMDGVEGIDFSPGANPFWTLEEDPYGDGVFPAVAGARDYLSFEETVAGLQHLGDEYADQLTLTTTGQNSPGWTNLFLETDERYPIYVAQMTNDIESTFEEKNKVVYTVSIHGDEPQGRETAIRLIEDILTGDAPEFEAVLDDIALVFVFINPDGWLSREPYTEIPYPQSNNPFEGVEFDDVNLLRGNGSFPGESQIDTNRQYPTIGWTNAGFYPAEPEDAPEFFNELVPDALGAVAHFRTYQNVEFLCDYHGMGIADQMVLNLETNASFDHLKTHNLDEVSIQIGEGMVGEFGDISTIGDDIAVALEEHYFQIGDGEGDQFVPQGGSYNGLLDWGTIYDTLSYQVTGAFLGWAGVPEEQGGLGAITVAPEMLHSNPNGLAFMNWKPYWARHQTLSYRVSMREYAKLAAADTEATVLTGNRTTAYVESGELTRSSDDLPHTGGETGSQSASGSTEMRREHASLSAGGVSTTSIESRSETHSMSIQFDATGNATGELRLRNPAGAVVRRIEFDRLDDQVGEFISNLFVSAPDAGQWTLEAVGDVAFDVSTTIIDADDVPDPREAWDGEGFEQREYEVNPLQFFDDLAPYIADDGSLQGITTDDVTSGLDEYDQLVVSHDVGIDDSAYVSAIESFVDGGGDLVLTDSGVNLLGALDVGDLGVLGTDNTEDVLVNFVNLDDRAFDHPLLSGIRSRQQEIWKGPQMGYTTATDQPATVVDPGAFEDAGGEMAGTIGGDSDAVGESGQGIEGNPGVGAGTIDVGDAEITILGSILPPANQQQLHPFGIADYAVSFMGHTLLCNALSFVQRRLRDGEVVRRYGIEPPAAVVGDQPPTDPDNDGLYEDVTGDGSFDIFDVQALFNNLDSDTVQNNPAAFNFNNDDNPDKVSIFDVQGLFNRFE
jgi:PKD repeat protein